ncbi:MAG: hypothetical protein PVG94_09550 [Gammaproteobacteria bacterium]
MRLRNCSIRYLAVCCLLAPSGVYADSWSCMRDENIREVIIEYPESGQLPCKVIYNKPTEGFETRVLWRADNEEGFCKEKANELVAKLESLGWKCYGEVTDDETLSENGAASDAEAE